MIRLSSIPLEELRAIEREGVAARFNGAGFFDNPYLWEPLGSGTDGLDAWADRGNAWSEGWRRQDQGRDEKIRRLGRIRFR